MMLCGWASRPAALPPRAPPSPRRSLKPRNFGVAVDCAGDTNGDGYLDLVIGAGATNQTYVIQGGPDGLDESTEIPLLGTGNFGLGVAGVGDVNGDGYDDVVVGGDGVVQVHLGSSSGTEPAANQIIEGTNPTFGNAVLGGRDVTGNGFNDLLIGSPGEGKPICARAIQRGFCPSNPE